jgi:hypothetical protein
VSDVPFEITIPVEKYDRKTRTITGWAAVVTGDDGTPLIDSDGHLIPVDVLKRGVQDAFSEQGGKGRVDINHDGIPVASLVGSFVLDNETRQKMDLGTSKREGWMVQIRAPDDPSVTDRLESGELGELSLKGTAQGKAI